MKFSTEDTTKAYYRYYQLTGVNVLDKFMSAPEASDFYYFTKTDYVGDDFWSCDRPDMMKLLLSPHYQTLWKVFQIQNEQT